MRLDEVMNRDVKCVEPKDPVQLAARRMRDENIGFLPVCDSSMKVLGAVTDRDIAVRVVAEGLPPNTAVGDVMTPEVVACHPEDDIRSAEQLMAEHQKSRLMVTDDQGRLVGVISLSDIAQIEDPSRAHQTIKRVTERESRLH